MTSQTVSMYIYVHIVVCVRLLTSARLAVDADCLSLVLSVCSLYTDEVGVGTLIKASAHRQQLLVGLTQHLQQLSKQREKRRNLN